MILIETHDGRAPLEGGHYRINQTGVTDEHKSAGVEYLKRQGCTRIDHYVDVDGNFLTSVGTVEPLNVVSQRAREPRCD